MKPKIILIFILLIGLTLRTFRLADRPLGFTWDEAAIGYNAYSLLMTGRDEWSQIAPIVFKSFGDYKPGLYIYTAVPSIAVFGLNEFSTRLPSAVFGTLLIIVVYLVTKELFTISYSLFTATTIALSPWAIHFSRGAWEANVALTLTTLATLLFLRRKFVLSSLFFGLTFWSYQGAKMFTPLLFLSLLCFYRPKAKLLFKPFLLLLLLTLPIIVGLGNQSGRLKVFSVFSYTRQPDSITEILRQDNTSSKNLVHYLFHSESLDQTRGIVQRYLNHFSSRFLFVEGDWSNPRQAPAPFHGNLHLPEILALVIGFYLLLKTHNPQPTTSNLILAWLLLAPLPSALSRDIVSGVRSLPMVVPLSIISGLGLAKLSQKKVPVLIYLSTLLFIFIYFLDLYFIHSPFYTASAWLYPYKQALLSVSQNLDKYSKIVISDKLGQPYIFTLFYLGIDPREFQNRFTFTDSPVGDVGAVTGYANFEFRSIFWPTDHNLRSTLFVGDKLELSDLDLQSTPNVITLDEIAPPDGYPNWRVVALP